MDGYERLMHKIVEEDDGMCIITVYDNTEHEEKGFTGYYKLKDYTPGDDIYHVDCYKMVDGDLLPAGVSIDIDAKYAVISNIITEDQEESEETPVEDDE